MLTNYLLVLALAAAPSGAAASCELGLAELA